MTTETKATSLHARIMNSASWPTWLDNATTTERTAYRAGHRDARHAAAELASEYEASQDAEIEDLSSRITAFQQAIDEANRRLDQREALVAQLVAVVEKLAAFADHYPMTKKYGNRPTTGSWQEVCSHGLPDAVLCVEDFHEARAALAAAQKGLG